MRQFFFSSKPKSDKVATNKTNNKRPFFLPKINKVFLSPILQNLKGRSVLFYIGQFFLNDPLDEPKKMPISKRFSGSRSKTQNVDKNQPLSLSLQNAKLFPLKRVLKHFW